MQLILEAILSLSFRSIDLNDPRTPLPQLLCTRTFLVCTLASSKSVAAFVKGYNLS